jgi:carbon catabolite-derepressing protein kinase
MRHLRVEIGDELVDLPSFFGNYEITKIIGSGAFSVVLLVTDRSKNDQFACKVVSRTFLVQSGTFHRFEQEIRLLEMLHHPNIVPVVDVIYDETLIFVVMEYCAGGELFQYLVDHGRLPESECRRIFASIVGAVSYLHSRGIAHRDLKPENILLTDKFVPKIADLGLCRLVPANALMMTPCGSPQYAAPEVLSGKGYDGRASDVWSLGVVLFVMATATVPWRSTDHSTLFQEICNGSYRIPAYITPQLRELIQKMMNIKVMERSTIEEVTKSQWMANERMEIGIEVPRGVTKAMSFDTRPSGRNLTMGKGDWQGKMVIRNKGIPQSLSGIQGKRTLTGQLHGLLRKVPPSGRPKPVGLQKIPVAG